MSNNPVKTYTNGEVTVRWEPSKCIHSARCVKGLPSVFNSGKRPWITIDGAETQQIIDQVAQCPSGALSTYMNDEADDIESIETERIVEVAPDGPLLVYGNISVKHRDGNVEKKSKVSAFCRCGASFNKPFCDGTHRKIGFSG